MAEPLITPVLSSEDRTAIGHAATELGRQLAEHCRRMCTTGLVLPWMAAFVSDRLADYLRCCDLAAMTPEAHWVEQIEAAIALPEAKS